MPSAYETAEFVDLSDDQVDVKSSQAECGGEQSAHGQKRQSAYWSLTQVREPPGRCCDAHTKAGKEDEYRHQHQAMISDPSSGIDSCF